MSIKHLLILFVLVQFNAFAQPDGVVVDKVAAQVGDNIILLSDIEAQKTQVLASGMKQTPNLSCEVLEQLMYQELLINQAKGF